MTSPFRLEAQSIDVQRGKGAKIISNNSDFSIQANTLYHLTGTSGSGKSTLLWTLARLYPLSSGVLKLNGRPHTQINTGVWRAEVGLLPQRPVIFSGGIQDNLLYPLKAFRLQRERLARRGDAWPTAQQLQSFLEKIGMENIPLDYSAASLSGGQQSRLALVRLLLTKPQVILADEPLAGLDENAVRRVLDCLCDFSRQGGAVIVTSHSYAEKIQGIPITLEGNASPPANECSTDWLV